MEIGLQGSNAHDFHVIGCEMPVSEEFRVRFQDFTCIVKCAN
jgi:hypothetical protein